MIFVCGRNSDKNSPSFLNRWTAKRSINRSNRCKQRSHSPTTIRYKMTVIHRNGRRVEKSLYNKYLQTCCFRFLLLLITPLFLFQIIKMSSFEPIDLLSYDNYLDVNNNDSILCGGCFFAKTDDGMTCGHYIRQHVFQSLFELSNQSGCETKTETTEEEKWTKIQQMQIFNKTVYTQIVRNAAYKASVDFPYVCSHCDPASCTRRSKKGGSGRSGTIYHSYDTAAPKVQQTWSPFLKSIPEEHRYPMEGIENPEAFLSIRANTKKIFYSEFNPSIIAIPDHERIHSFKHPTTGVATVPVYLTSYRVSQYFLCMGYGSPHNLKLFHFGGKEKELMGLAFLDENFVVLADAVYKTEEEDIRLVTLPSPYDNNKLQIYLTYCTLQRHIDDVFRRAIQRELWLNRPSDKFFFETKNPFYVDGANSVMPPIYIHQYPNCLTVTDAFIDAKNIVYFVDATISSETTLGLFENGVNYTKKIMSTPVIVAENWPPQNDRTHKVSFIEANNRRWCPAFEQYRKTDGELVSSNETSTIENRTIQPSFYTMEEQLYGENLISHIAPWESDRGNACCIEMIDPRTNQNVLVGISHAKLYSEDNKAYNMLPDAYKSAYRGAHNAYLSRFYAFEPIRPYRTVALSGHFCWPIITSNIGNLSNPFANVGEKLQFIQPINQTNRTSTGWCPTIHFVMSLLYKVNSNKSSIIISFGVNDCTPRLIEVLTSDITELLFYGISSQ